MKIVNSHKTIARTDNNNDKIPNDTKQIILKLCAAFTHVVFFLFCLFVELLTGDNDKYEGDSRNFTQHSNVRRKFNKMDYPPFYVCIYWVCLSQNKSSR